MRVEKGQVLTLENNLNLDEVLEVYGTLRFNPQKSIKLTTRKNIINYGKIEMKPATPSILHEVQFIGVDNTKFVGGGTDPIDSDIGWWNQGAGVMDIEGAFKVPFTTLTGSIKAGVTSITVIDATGWKENDEIVVSPTEIPDANSRSWDTAIKGYKDNFVDKFERRVISKITGNVISFTLPLKYNHDSITTQANFIAPSGRVYHPFVHNNTRNVKIYAEKGKTSHIFSCAHSYNADGSVAHNVMKHAVKNAEVFYMGVRKVQSHRYQIPETILGRYVMHFHHAGDGTNGTVVSGCAFHDNNSRCFVPHHANGITFSNNVVYNNLAEGWWYDFQDMTHNNICEKNLFASVLWDGVQLGGTCLLVGIGDHNIFRDNWVVYGNQGDPDGSGAYQWTTDSEGVAEFIRNHAMCCHNPDWTWQNSGRSHTIAESQFVNNIFGLTHGAYGNLYQYILCEWYNSRIKVRASGPTFHRCVLDGMNKIPEVAYIQTSAVGGPNNFHECELKNAPVAFSFDVHPHNGEFATPRTLNLVNNKYVNIGKKYQFVQSAPGIVPNLEIKSQEGNTAKRMTPMANESTIGKFAPDKYGTGDGLRAEFFKGMNFETKVADYVKALVREDDWRIDLPKMPNGAHYKFILPDKVSQSPFSVRFTGQVESYYTGNHRFRLYGGSGFRLWIADRLIIDSPGNKHDNGEFVDSAWIGMTAGNKVNIKIEVYEPGDKNMGIKLMWEGPGFGLRDVETSQLYSGTSTKPPVEPTVYRNKRLEQDFTRNNCPAGQVGSVYTSVVEEGEVTSTISQADADAKAQALIDKHGQAEANAFGTCTIVSMTYKNVRMETDFVRNNCATGFTGSTYKFVVAAGMFVSTISQADADAKAVAHINAQGQLTANELGICTPVTAALQANAGPDQIIKTNTTTIDGSASTGTWIKVNWTRDSGPGKWDPSEQNNIKTVVKAMAVGTHIIKLRLTDAAGKFSEDRLTVTVLPTNETFTNVEKSGRNECIDGTIITYTVPAGKYSGITQATADALAIQELNTELAKCPLPYFSAKLPNGKTLYLFGESEPYKIIIK